MANAYAQDTVRMEMRGSILNAQSWSTGLWFGTSGFPVGATYGIDQLNGLRDSSDLQGYWSTFFTTMAALMTSALKVTEINYSLYSGASKAAQLSSIWIPSSPFVGTGSLEFPPEVACAVSLRTNDHSASGRGRSYFPMLANVTDGSTGGLAISTAGEIADAYQALLHSIANHPFDSNISGGDPYNLYPSLASYKATTNHPLTQLIVDTRLDSQRRRENKLAKSSVSRTLP